MTIHAVYDAEERARAKAEAEVKRLRALLRAIVGNWDAWHEEAPPEEWICPGTRRAVDAAREYLEARR